MRRYLVLLSMLLVMAPLALARAEIVVSFYSRDLQLRGLGELCLILGDGVDQAANFTSCTTSIPSLNFTPLMIFGN